jgi:hypothetical protein
MFKLTSTGEINHWSQMDLSMNEICLVGIAGADQSGKSTLAQKFQEHGYFSAEISPILMEAGRPLGWNGTKDNTPFGREFLIRLGMALKQEFGDEFLVQLTIERAILKGHSLIVVPSIRTLKESGWILSHGGIMVKIRRPDVEQKTIPLYLEHLEQMLYHYEIINDKSLEDFRDSCEIVISEIEKQEKTHL